MNSSTIEYMKNITNQLFAIPTNTDFTYPLQNIVKGYTNVISRPMDLNRVRTKIQENEYSSVGEWYADVILMYENCIKFYSQVKDQPYISDLYITLANYNMKKFKEMTPGLECTTENEWYEKTKKAFEKLIKVAGESPVPQGIDPMIPKVYDFAEPLVPLKPVEIAQTVDALNRLMDKEYVKKDIVMILKEMEPNLKMDEDYVSIDADKLKEDTLKALWVYLKAHETQ